VDQRVEEESFDENENKVKDDYVDQKDRNLKE
jgi:hypothetical protein